MSEADRADKEWHLDKRVNISIIVSVVVQTVAAVWWASGINTRVARLEQDRAASSMPPTLSDRMTRVETFVDGMRNDLIEIKSDVKSLLRRNQ